VWCIASSVAGCKCRYLFGTGTGALEQELHNVFPKKASYSPYADRHFPERVYWGDTHLHTSFSMDAGAFGCRLGPRDAYRFAKGQEVTASSGQPVRLARPLDFLAVTDHSDGFGFFPLLLKGDPAIMADPQGRRWHDQMARLSARSNRRCANRLSSAGISPSMSSASTMPAAMPTTSDSGVPSCAECTRSGGNSCVTLPGKGATKFQL